MAKYVTLFRGTNALVTSGNVMDVTKVYCSDTTRSPNSKKTLLNILNEVRDHHHCNFDITLFITLLRSW